MPALLAWLQWEACLHKPLQKFTPVQIAILHPGCSTDTADTKARCLIWNPEKLKYNKICKLSSVPVTQNCSHSFFFQNHNLNQLVSLSRHHGNPDIQCQFSQKEKVDSLGNLKNWKEIPPYHVRTLRTALHLSTQDNTHLQLQSCLVCLFCETDSCDEKLIWTSAGDEPNNGAFMSNLLLPWCDVFPDVCSFCYVQSCVSSQL